MMAKAVGSIAGKFKGWVGDKVTSAFGKVKGLFSGGNTFTTKEVQGFANATVSAMGNFTGAGGHLSPSVARSAGKKMMPKGWSFAALNNLWNRESGWRWNADNPGSSAYGIPQSLPGSKMRSAGADWHDNALTQIRWGLGYIRNRYGSSGAAWAHSQAHGWYDSGGVASGTGLMAKNTIRPERVLSPAQTEAFDRLVKLLEKTGGLKSIASGIWKVFGGKEGWTGKALAAIKKASSGTSTSTGSTTSDSGKSHVRSGTFNAHTYGHSPKRTIADLHKVLPNIDSLALQEWTGAAGGAVGYLRKQGFGLFRGPTGTAIAWRKSRFNASRLNSLDLNKRFRMPKGTSQRYAVYGLLTDKKSHDKFWQVSSHFIPNAGFGGFGGHVSKARRNAILGEQKTRLAKLVKRLREVAPVIAGGDYNTRGGGVVRGLKSNMPGKIDQIYSNLVAHHSHQIRGLASDHDATVGSYKFDAGGVALGRGHIEKLTIRPERVLSPSQTESFDRLVKHLERGGAPLVNVEQMITHDPAEAAYRLRVEQAKALTLAKLS